MVDMLHGVYDNRCYIGRHMTAMPSQLGKDMHYWPCVLLQVSDSRYQRPEMRKLLTPYNKYIKVSYRHNAPLDHTLNA